MPSDNSRFRLLVKTAPGPAAVRLSLQWSAVQLHDDAAAGSTTTWGRAHVGHPYTHVGHPYTEVFFKDRRIG